VRSKERRKAYIHEVGHVDTNHVELEPPGDFPHNTYGLVLAYKTDCSMRVDSTDQFQGSQTGTYVLGLYPSP
jgi:hypothetical protein